MLITTFSRLPFYLEDGIAEHTCPEHRHQSFTAHFRIFKAERTGCLQWSDYLSSPIRRQRRDVLVGTPWLVPKIPSAHFGTPCCDTLTVTIYDVLPRRCRDGSELRQRVGAAKRGYVTRTRLRESGAVPGSQREISIETHSSVASSMSLIRRRCSSRHAVHQSYRRIAASALPASEQLS